MGVWDLSDEALVAAMASGDAAAAAAFVRRFQARVYGLALSVVDDPGLAEKVAQDAFVHAWRNAPAYDPRSGGIVPWLFAITRNFAIDAVRPRRADVAEPQRLLRALTGDAPEARSPDGRDDAERLRRCLRSLPPEQSGPLVLSVYFGLTAADIAEREGVSPGTARTRMRRGLARLRRALRPCT